MTLKDPKQEAKATRSEPLVIVYSDGQVKLSDGESTISLTIDGVLFLQGHLQRLQSFLQKQQPAQQSGYYTPRPLP